MRSFLRILLAFLFLVACLLPWRLRQPVKNQWRKEARELSEQASQWNDVRAENERLSKALTHVNRGGQETNGRPPELNNLRALADKLRRETNELGGLVNKAQITNDDRQPAGLIGRTYRRETWSATSYDSPEQALEAIFLAMRDSDWTTFFNSMTPSMRAWTEAQLKDTEGKVAEALEEMSAKTQAYRVTHIRTNLEDRVTFYTVLEQPDQSNTEMPMVLKYTNGQWKLDWLQSRHD